MENAGLIRDVEPGLGKVREAGSVGSNLDA